MKTKFFLLFFFYFSFFPYSAHSQETINIPVLVGQTGASSSFGKEELNAYRLATKEWNKRGGINNKKVILQVEDTQTKQVQIVTAYKKIALSRPTLILGPTWLDGFPAIIPMAKKQNIALVTPSAATEAFGKYTGWPVSFYYNTTLEIQKLVFHIKESKLDENIALIYETEPFSELVRSLLLKQTSNIAYDIGIQGGESDFNAILAKLKSKKPTVLFILVWEERSLLSLLQQLRTLLPDLKLVTIHDGESWIKKEHFKKYIPNLIYSKFFPANNSFIEKYKKEYNEVPFLTASTAYDAANSVFKALEDGANSGEDIRKFLLNNEIDTTTFGKITISKNGGVPVSNVRVVEYNS